MSSLVHITILKKELTWLENNASLIQRLKRAVVREYLNSRVKTLSQELEDMQAAKKLLKNDKTTRVLIKKNKELENDTAGELE
tara:strand:- start:94 stop:342 length:249 start_codon:yes stop_codon:yes gene_type:complete